MDLALPVVIFVLAVIGLALFSISSRWGCGFPRWLRM